LIVFIVVYYLGVKFALRRGPRLSCGENADKLTAGEKNLIYFPRRRKSTDRVGS
jgi:hypothetical protein